MARTTLIALLYVWAVVIILLLLVGIGMSRQRLGRMRKDAPQPVPDELAPGATAGKTAHGKTAHLLL
jgi:hypothetical protein